MQAKAASDLDVILGAHEAYLRAIVARCLLDDGAAGLRRALDAIFATCLDLLRPISSLAHAVRISRHKTYAFVWLGLRSIMLTSAWVL